MPSADRLDQLKKRYDENPKRFFAPLANEYRKAGEFDQAIALCQLHMADQALNLNGQVVFGQALYEAGRFDEAKATFETALTLDPENLIALRHLGDIARTAGAKDQARVWYRRVLDADPRSEEIAGLLERLDSGSETAHDGRPAAPEPVAPPENVGLMELSIDFTTADTTADFPGFGEPARAAPSPAAPSSAAAPFVTETMAELYLQQGFAAEALDVYRQLSAQAPGDENLKQHVRELENPLGDTLENPFDVTLDLTLDDTLDNTRDDTVDNTRDVPVDDAPSASVEPTESPRTVRAYLARLAARRAVKSPGRARVATPAPTPAPTRAPAPAPAPVAAPTSAPVSASRAPAHGGSLDALFGDGPVSSTDENVALTLAQVAGAVEMGLASVKGRPTAPAATELSLDSVFSIFRDSDMPATDAVPRQSQKLRFDQFFATRDDAPAAAPAPTGAAPADEPGSPAELKHFQSWLQGLKKP